MRSSRPDAAPSLLQLALTAAVWLAILYALLVGVMAISGGK